jgi:uncharacterized protein YggU (UPF0235/DUF167 family)
MWRTAAGGVEVVVRLTPRAASDAVDGAGADASGRTFLKARVRAVPEKGAANAALARLLAKWLDVPASRIVVTAGAASRIKTVRIVGDASELEKALARRLGPAA